MRTAVPGGGISGMTAAVGLGLVVYWLMIRRVMGEPPHVGLMLTVGLGTMLNGLMIVLFGGGMLGIPTGLPGFTQLGTVRLPTADIVAAVGAWLAIGAIALVYHLTDIGLQMRAVAEKVMLSAQRGLNIDRTVALSWAIGILAAGLAGHPAWRTGAGRVIRVRDRHQRPDRLPDRRNG